MNRSLVHALGVAAVAALVIALPFLTDNAFYLRVALLIGVNYIAAAGLNVLVGHAGQKSLGHAGLYAVGAYTAALLTARAGWDPWLAFAASGVMAGLFGVLIALPALRVAGPALAMVTIGFGIVVEKIVTEWQDVFAGQQGIYGVLPLTWNGSMFGMQHWVWFTGALAIVLHLLLRALLHGRFGRAFRAVAAAEVAAESVGVSVYRFKVLAFVISAVTCGWAGAIIAQQNQYISSDFITFTLSVFLLLIVLFGGSSIYGPLLGAVVLTMMDAFLARWPGLQHFTYGALLLFALYVMPNGLAGAVRALAQRIAPRWMAPDAPPQPSGQWHLRADGATRSSDQPLLTAQGLYKAYGGVVPVQDVDLDLRSGHVHSLIGPNGAGKTTLLNILSGIVRPDRGSIDFAGRNVVGLPTNRISAAGLGRTFQNLRLFGDMSVLDNVRVGLHRHIPAGFTASLLGLPSATRAERQAAHEAMQILALLGLDGHAQQVASSLPYGLQRRLEIARALGTHPQLLLLDEPAAGMNPQETHALVGDIRRIRELGVTVLLIEHHMDLVMAISDHVLVLDYGVKIAEGKPAEIQHNPRVIAAYLGSEEVSPDEGDAPEEATVAVPAHAATAAAETPKAAVTPKADAAPLLSVQDLQVRYGAIEALRGVSIDVHPGEIVTIIGSNGAGKSTLMRAISGLVGSAGGSVRFDGQDVTRIPGYQRLPLGIAQSPEGRQVFSDQTVRDNLLLGAYRRRGDADRVEADLQARFATFPRLRERQHQYAGTMSGGEQQMLAIARALMSRPRLLLLDEPSLGLAPLIVREIFDVIRMLRDEGVTILLVEQMANQALAVADRAYVLETGRITLQGPARELLRDPKVRAAYLGEH